MTIPVPDLDLEEFAAPQSARPWRRLPKYPAVFHLTSLPAKFHRPENHQGKAPSHLADGTVGGKPVLFAVPGTIAGVIDASGLNVPLVYKDGSIYRVRS